MPLPAQQARCWFFPWQSVRPHVPECWALAFHDDYRREDAKMLALLWPDFAAEDGRPYKYPWARNG
eukprot:5776934-Pyramimonas_sp.AAC.1